MKAPRLSDLIRRPPADDGEVTLPPAPSASPAGVPEGNRAGTALPPPSESSRVGGRALLSTRSEAEAGHNYELLERWLADVHEQTRRGSFEPGEIFEDVAVMLERPKLLDALFAETFRHRDAGNGVARNSLNVAVYALRLGTALGFGESDLVELGVAGLLHKIGLAQLPRELVSKPGRLSAGELPVLRKYPKVGRELLRTAGDRFARISEIVYQVQERLDGSGYPRHLMEGEIAKSALIIGLVGIFDALIQPRPYRQRMIPFAAVKELLEREKEHFPRTVLREFVAAFSAFPPFTYVRLNSKAIARVLETEPGHPLRPVVAVVLDANGLRPSEPQTLRLRESPLLYITGPVTEEEIPA